MGHPMRSLSRFNNLLHAACIASIAALFISNYALGAYIDRLHLISTIKATSAASIAWTGLGTTYHTFFLACYGLFPATATQNIYLQVGEGNTPTWETSSYKWISNALNASSTTNSNSVGSSDSGIDVSAGTLNNTATTALNMNAYLSDIQSTAQVKILNWQGAFFGTDFWGLAGSGAYTGDTNAVTAVRVISSSGNINGTCSLYAVVQ